MAHDWIAVRGARVHNLKNIDVDLPRDRLVVITGLSGSGKSSLAFDTIYAEGQRRYVESLSAYARQFLEQMEKPDVDLIDGLSPAISIEQKTTGSNPRSTVGTVTEIYDYLRLLFANTGTPHCYNCGREISSQSLERILDLVMLYPTDARINIMAPIVRGRKGEFKKELQALRQRGYSKVRVDGQFRSLDEDLKLDRRRNHTIEVVVDRLIVKSGIERRLSESLETALSLADDIVVVNTFEGGDQLFSRRLACIRCGISMPEMTPRAFSFNSPHGACPSCQGLGATYDFDARLVVPDESLSLLGGAIAPWIRGDRKLVKEAVMTLARTYGLDPDAPFGKLPRKHRELVLFGPAGAARQEKVAAKAARVAADEDDEEDEEFELPRRRSSGKSGGDADPFGRNFEGVIPNLRRRYEEGSWAVQEDLEPYRTLRECPVCHGQRLKPQSLAVKVKGRGIAEYVNLPISDVLAVFESFELSEREALVAGRVLREIRERLRFLDDVGVGYLTLNRSAATLSGGEGQRIRLATQIGANLTGVLYVLDEPSIGLHQRDNRRLLTTLSRLRDLGNTVVVVEHDEETIRTADYVVDLGPGAGEHGGHVIFQGEPAQLLADGHGSLTGAYLRGERSIPTPAPGARLEGRDRHPRRARQQPEEHRRRHSARDADRGDWRERLRQVDARERHPVPFAGQDDLSSRCRTRRSRSHRRDLAHRQGHRDRSVADRPDAAVESRHVYRHVHVHPRAVRDDARGQGARVQAGTLLVQRQGWALRGMPGRWRDRNRDALPPRRLRDVRTVQGAAIQQGDARDPIPRQVDCRGPRPDGGPGAAAARELSADRQQAENAAGCRARLHRARAIGGDAERRGGSAREACARAVAAQHRADGLHPRRADDRAALRGHRKLLDVLNKLVDQGNTVVVIEHNLDVIRCADHVIDLGPEGGAAGGQVVAVGSPEAVARRRARHGTIPDACSTGIRPDVVNWPQRPSDLVSQRPHSSVLKAATPGPSSRQQADRKVVIPDRMSEERLVSGLLHDHKP